MASKRPFQTFYSRKNRPTNSTRFDKRGRSASISGALARAMKAYVEQGFRRIEIYNELDCLVYIILPMLDGNPPGSMRVVKVNHSTGAQWPVDRPLKGYK